MIDSPTLVVAGAQKRLIESKMPAPLAHEWKNQLEESHSQMEFDTGEEY